MRKNKILQKKISFNELQFENFWSSIDFKIFDTNKMYDQIQKLNNP